MEFNNAESRRVKLCLIGNSKLNQMVHALIPEFRSIADITIIDSIFRDAAASARHMVSQDEVDVFMSAGANAFYLKDTLPKPVIVLEVKQSDIMHSVLRARVVSQRILLLTYQYQATWTDFLAHFEGLEVVHKTYVTAEDARDVFHSAEPKGFGVVIGSSYVCDLAEEVGLPSVLLYSRESCRAMIEKAISVAGESKRESEKNAFIDFLLHNSPTALIVTNFSDKAVAFNDKAKALLPKLGRGRSVSRFMDARFRDSGETVAEGMVVNNRICRITKRFFDVAGKHVGHVYSIVASPEPQPQDDQIEEGRTLVFQSQQMTEASDLLSLYGATPGAVLLRGETGTGKELAARQVHEVSPFSDGPFVAINCAAIPGDLFESELFGYADGAFTHARSGGKSGVLETANNGTFFMDEINSLPLPQQAKLLRVLQEKEVTPVGSRTSIPLNLKLVAACNYDLLEEVRAGRFREDLYYRLNVFTVRLPSLRERIEDIEPLTRYFLLKLGKQYQIEVDINGLSQTVLPYFKQYSWPGNVRQLENILERLLVSVSLFQSLEDFERAFYRLVPELCPDSDDGSQTDGGHLRQVEQDEIRKVLEQLSGNKTRAAEYLGISQTTLWRRLRTIKTG